MLDYLDFELELGAGSSSNGWPLAVLQSPAGNLRGVLALPDRALAAARPAQPTLLMPPGDALALGRLLFESLFVASGLHPAYAESQGVADGRSLALRIKLRILDPMLAALPWELLYDPRLGEFLALSHKTALVRCVEASQALPVLSVTPPLRILGLAVDPSGGSDLRAEQENVERALAPLVATGAAAVTWLEGGSWRDLQRSLRPGSGPWHIFHFVGHGGLHVPSGEGFLLLAGEQGGAHPLRAADLGRLLAGHPSLRLAVLNACHGAASGPGGLYTSVAGALIQRGVPAVVAMQHAVTQAGGFELSRTFYEALASGMALEAALTEARIAASLAHPAGLDWAAPVACLRASGGALFRLVEAGPGHHAPADAARTPPEAMAVNGPVNGPVDTQLVATPFSTPAAGVGPAAGPGAAPAAPRELVEALARGEVVPFVGAAFAALGGLPDWYTLVAELAQRSSQAMPPPQWATPAALIDIAQAYADQHGVNHLVALLRERLDVAAAPSAAHTALATLPVDLIFCASHDDLLERALRSAGRRTISVVRDGDIPFMRRAAGAVNVVKLFGDLNQPDTLVITRRQHDRYLLDRPQLVKLLETELGRSTLLYLGWQRDEPQFARLYGEVLARYGSLARRGYAAIFDPPPGLVEELRRSNVQPLSLPGSQAGLAAAEVTAGLAAWLQALRGAL